MSLDQERRNDVERKKLKIAFVDFWDGLDNFFLYQYVKEHFTLIDSHSQDDQPDLIICSVFNDRKNSFECPKLFVSYENYERWMRFNPKGFRLDCEFNIVNNNDLNLKDYLFSSCGAIYYDLDNHDETLKLQNHSKRKLSSFVFSNGHPNDLGVQLRCKLLNYLNTPTKKVDSLGPCLNNVGYILPREKHIDTLSEYKFNICIENSYGGGYFTEKPFSAYMAESIPIYNAHESVLEWLNKDAMVWVENHPDSFKRAEIEIDNLNKHDDLYIEKLNKSLIKRDRNGKIPSCLSRKAILQYLEQCIEKL